MDHSREAMGPIASGLWSVRPSVKYVDDHKKGPPDRIVWIRACYFVFCLLIVECEESTEEPDAVIKISLD